MQTKAGNCAGLYGHFILKIISAFSFLFSLSLAPPFIINNAETVKPGFHLQQTPRPRHKKQSDYLVEQSSFLLIALCWLKISRCRGRNWFYGNQALTDVIFSFSLPLWAALGENCLVKPGFH